MAVDIGEMLDRLLTEGARHSDDTHDYELTMVPVGDVTLPTGRVVACDPLIDTGEAPPFTVAVPPGRYSLRAWVAVAYVSASRLMPPAPRALLATDAHADAPPSSAAAVAVLPDTQMTAQPLRHRVEAGRSIAALQLVIRDEPVTAWEPALVPDAEFLDEDGFTNHPVDTGLATLADERALKALSTWDYELVERTFVPSRPPESPGAVGAVTDAPTGANVLAVPPGCGDGAYATFVGRTANGEVGCFVTDFRVI